jgi:hypothetical protein
MNPIEKITSREIETFAEIVENHSAPNANYSSPDFDMDNFPFIVRFWNEQKKNLFHIFNENLILEKEVSFPMIKEEGEEQMYQIKQNSPFIEDFYNWRRTIPSPARFGLLRLVNDNNLYTNTYDGDTIKIDNYTLREGAKTIKALGKLNQKFIHSKNFEEFRIAHSMVLNQKAIKGTLCLSIHPLDYITMSDNSYDWDSCMSWITDVGSHRCGTIEMMNSPCVVVAYLKGDKPFMGCSNKKWRSLFIVTKDLISAVKPYPYENKYLTQYCLDWLRELVESSNYSTYYPTTYSVISNEAFEIKPHKTVDFDITTNFMYNDYYGEYLSYVSTSTSTSGTIFINYSGVLNCMICGELYDPIDTCFVGCEKCFPFFCCDECDCWRHEDERSDSGENICRYCEE